MTPAHSYELTRVKVDEATGAERRECVRITDEDIDKLVDRFSEKLADAIIKAGNDKLQMSVGKAVLNKVYILLSALALFIGYKLHLLQNLFRDGN